MLVVEAKLKNGTSEQYKKLDEAIRTSQFVRNSCVRYWIENIGLLFSTTDKTGESC